MNNITATIENFKNKIINNKHTNLIHTGYKDLDYFLAQLESGSLVTIGGRPCMGKSTFSYSLINNILEFNKKLVLFSTKTKKEKIVPRLIAEKSKIDINKIYSGKPYDIKTIMKYADFYKDKDLNIIDTARLTIHDIKNDITKYQPDIIFLDDIQSMYISQNKETLNEIVKELKQIALEQNLIIFITSQLSRRVENRKLHVPVIHDLSNCEILDELSDVIILLYKESYYFYEDTANQDHEIIIAKNKNGPTGSFYLTFKPTFFTERLLKDVFDEEFYEK